MASLADEINSLCRDWEVETGKHWRIARYKTPAPDKVMETAFARLADELEAQAAAELEEMADLWDVWQYMKENSGQLSNYPHFQRITLDYGGAIKFDNSTGKGLPTAAEWIRKQEGNP